MYVLKILFVVSSSLLLSACTVFGIRNSEEAAHVVIYEENDIQIRQYEEALIAQTQTNGNYDDSSTSAFEILAGYIFGENNTQVKIEMKTPVLEKNKSEKIAMTIPVYQEKYNDAWTMTFVLPS